MSKHIFTVEVECEDSAEYESAIHTLSSLGDILDEESDFSV